MEGFDGRFRFTLSNGIEALNGGLFVSPGFGIHPTRVIDSHELIFVAQGCLDMFEAKESLHVAVNQTLLLFPGKRHGGTLPYTPDVHFYWVHFRLHENGASRAVIRVPRLADVRDPELLTEMFCRFISDQESGILDPVSAAHLVALMLCEASSPERDWSARGAAHPHAARAARGAASRARAQQQVPLAQEIQAYIDRKLPGTDNHVLHRP